MGHLLMFTNVTKAIYFRFPWFSKLVKIASCPGFGRKIRIYLRRKLFRSVLCWGTKMFVFSFCKFRFKLFRKRIDKTSVRNDKRNSRIKTRRVTIGKYPLDNLLHPTLPWYSSGTNYFWTNQFRWSSITFCNCHSAFQCLQMHHPRT